MVANPRSLSESENNEVAAFNTSEIGLKIEAKRTSLTKDITQISQDWSRELFIEKMTALTKFGYKPLKPKPKKKATKKKTANKPLSDAAVTENAKRSKLANPDN